MKRDSLEVVAVTCDVISTSDWTLFFNASNSRCDAIGSSFLAVTAAVRQTALADIGDHPMEIRGGLDLVLVLVSVLGLGLVLVLLLVLVLCLSVCPSVRLSVCLSACLSVSFASRQHILFRS